MARKVDVAPLPANALGMDADCYVVIDVFRATTTIATLFARGLHSLIACAEIDDARRLAKEHDALLFGEVGGLRPEGFGYGNSPVEAMGAPVEGRTAVLFTTNGTLALVQCAGRGQVFAGAFVNAEAVAAALAPHSSIVLVCAGNESGRVFALEDFAGAGAIARRLVAADPALAVGDAARAAIAVSPLVAAESEHAARLRAIGLEADIAFALSEDTFQAVPAVVEHATGRTYLERR
jgi:2-phosphosulfolactate phosphatase